ncbi:unnamed protein product [Linum trigynum]|uniref:Uncharacterized protein n=1 Tax=Linum trigynum TaxID=586398 RepID=A0AAV2FEL4_9ROSI
MLVFKARYKKRYIWNNHRAFINLILPIRYVDLTGLSMVSNKHHVLGILHGAPFLKTMDFKRLVLMPPYSSIIKSILLSTFSFMLMIYS